MTRKQFILSHGATCDNWTWSWSFVNHKKKFVIFGAWDRYTEGNASLILNQEWEGGKETKRSPGYKQSREHIRLTEEENYALKTFPIKYSDAKKNRDGTGPAKISGFDPVLTEKKLKKIGSCWHAFDTGLKSSLPEEIDSPENYIEGASRTVVVNSFERNPAARKKCIKHHGCICAVCSFSFEKFYGPMGENYIHVHHIVPLHEIRKEYKLDPVKDLIPICPNCHAMIHRTQQALSISTLRGCINKKQG